VRDHLIVSLSAAPNPTAGATAIAAADSPVVRIALANGQIPVSSDRPGDLISVIVAGDKPSGAESRTEPGRS
jgi:hypothetical protein